MDRPRILRPPQLLTIESGGERHATWTELFYDLVFVVAVAGLASRLLHNADWGGGLAFIGLFVPLWWAWASFTFYVDRYDTDDAAQRLFAIVQMIAIAFMAVSISGDVADTSIGYALSYIVARLALLAMYARARRHVQATRELVTGYLKGFSVELIPWIASLFVPTPWRYVLWAIGLAISFYTPWAVRKIQAKVPLDVAHLPERFGLFTILVLGESIAAVVAGLSHHEWALAPSVTGALAVIVAAGLWWMYFDNQEGSVVRRDPTLERAWKPTVWIFSHLPLAMALTAVGVGLDLAVEHKAGQPLGAGELWLLVLAVGGSILSMAVIHIATQSASGNHPIKARVRLVLTAATLVVGLLGASLSPLVLVSLLAVIVAVGVASDITLNSFEDRANALAARAD